MNYRPSYFKNNVFIKYILSYIFILLIPICVIGLFTYNYFINLYEKEVIKSNVDMIEKVKSNVDVQISQAYKISLQLNRERSFSREYMQMNVTYFNDIIRSLANTRNFNEFIHDILFYRHGEDAIYSALYYKCNIDIYLNSISTYKEWNADDFKSAVNLSDQSFWRGSEEISDNDVPRQVVTYVGINKDNDTTILVLINSEKLDAAIKSFYSDTGKTIILDNQGNQIYSYPGNSIIDEPLLMRIKESTSSSEYIADRNLDGNHIYYTKSSITGFIYIRQIPLKYALNRVNILRKIMLFSFIGLFLLCTILIYILARSNYKPIRQLGKVARSFYPNIPDNPNEIETTKYVMESLSQLNIDIVTASQKPFKEHMVLKLLKGAYGDLQSFNHEGQKIGIELTGNFYRVAIFIFSENYKEYSSEHVTPEIMESMFKGDLKAYFIDGLDKSSMISVLFGASMADEDLLRYLQQLLCKISVSSSNIRVGIGLQVKSLTEIFSSYNEAKIALKHNSPANQNNILFYKDSDSSNRLEFNYPRAELETLHTSILERKPAKVEFIIEDLIRMIETEKVSYFISVCLGFDIISTFIKAFEEIGINLTNFLYKKLDRDSLHELGSIDNLAASIRKICTEACAHLSEQSIPKPSGLAEKVLSYIEENIFNQNLSIQAISDMMGMSLSNLSHQFKKETGENISTVINRYRIEKTKELLRHTGTSLAEIGSMIGYSQVTSFVRKFKQSEDITPGEYRKLYGNKCNPD